MHPYCEEQSDEATQPYFLNQNIIHPTNFSLVIHKEYHQLAKLLKQKVNSDWVIYEIIDAIV